MSARWDGPQRPEPWRKVVLDFIAFLAVAAMFFVAITAVPQ